MNMRQAATQLLAGILNRPVVFQAEYTEAMLQAAFDAGRAEGFAAGYNGPSYDDRDETINGN